MNETTIGKLSQDEFNRAISPLKLDLVACFKIIEEDIYKTINEEQKKGLTPDQIIEEVLNKI